MSLADLDNLAGRAGRLDCVCPAGAGEGVAARDNLIRLSAGFGLAILAQTLVLSALPLASQTLAPQPWLAGLPYALTLLGAAVATAPASLLLDSFGRRAAFALGASLGVAGGALAAIGAVRGMFAALCIGSLWLGFSNGFALFYRHAAAAGAAGPRGGALVFAAGALAALLAPLLMQAATSFGGPFVDGYALAMAGLADLLGLLVAIMLPHALAPAQQESKAPGASGLAFVTAAGAAAWFVMTWVMARAAPSLVACGVATAAASGIVAWHLIAMYAPAAIARILSAPFQGAAGLTGAALLATGAAVFGFGANASWISAGMLAAGAGWSLVNAWGLQRLYRDGRPGRGQLALHDFALLSAALCAALVAPLV
ncbi:MAG: hypothetical protein KGL46_06050 [Hyphomicrobiales bacterium]|nr:hypothetical protein [Hyphomicrobiales bacterium]